jgi:predicted O-methyltransferase YrrM
MSRGFREELLNYVLKNSRSGDVTSVIDTIDKYGWTQQALMNIGDTKGKILDVALQSRQPKTVLELGRFSLKHILTISVFFFLSKVLFLATVHCV